MWPYSCCHCQVRAGTYALRIVLLKEVVLGGLFEIIARGLKLIEHAIIVSIAPTSSRDALSSVQVSLKMKQIV